LLIDVDPCRPSGISSTNAEHLAALTRARDIREWLASQGWPEIALADSGNGAHLLAHIDLPNDDDNRDILRRVLETLDARFSDNVVAVDRSTFNAARLCRVYPSLNRKGDATADRPHRLAQLVEIPTPLEPIPRELLSRLARTAPTRPSRPASKGTRKASGRFDIDAWLSDHADAIHVVNAGPWREGRRWVLDPCPWNPEHTNKSAYIVELRGGALAAGCHHRGCGDKDWQALRDAVEPGWQDVAARDAGAGGRDPVALMDNMALFHSTDGETAFATIPVGEHHETWPIRSRAFRRWVTGEMFRQNGKPPKAQHVADQLTLLEALAQFDGPAHDVFVRLAQRDDKLFLDLANPEWEVVEIDASGWRVVSESPVRFRRPRGMQALPRPLPGGSLSHLRQFLNTPSDPEWVLLGGALISMFRPGPHLVVIFQGEQGTAKSTATRVMRALIDPNVAPLRATPRDERDLAIAASNAWLVVFDNVSYLPPWLSDALCRLATGGGFGTRELYTDDEERLFDYMRPIILNGIEEIVTRPDLLDRAMLISLPLILEAGRREEKEFWRAFKEAQPRLLGALLDAVSLALRREPEVVLDRRPRMADVARFIVAAEPALGVAPGLFMDSYLKNREAATSLALEASLLVGELQKWLIQENGTWKGTATVLLEKLNLVVEADTKRLKAWPKSPSGLSNALRRLAPALRKTGIVVEFGREESSRWISITKERDRSATGARRSESPGGDA